MIPIIHLALLFLLSLVMSFIMLKLLIPTIIKYGIVDRPNYRKIHKHDIPRGGGIVIVIIFILFILFYNNFSSFNILNNTNVLFTSFLLISSISFIDDIKGVSILLRLLIHILCAGLIVLEYIYPSTLFLGYLPLMFDSVACILILVTFLNIYNFLDGIDGITGIQTLHLSICILVLSYLNYNIVKNPNLLILISTILIGFSISFLFFNKHPAKIFIGDVGSIGIGFLLGTCLLFLSISSYELIFSSIICSLYYLSDGLITIIIRLINGEKIWQPHLKHFFQKAIRNGLSNNQVIKRIALCNIILMCLSINALSYPIISLILGIITVSIIFISYRIVK